MAISTRDPADMTGQERMQEIAAILAACVKRFQKNERKQCDKAIYERSLTGLQGRMKHSCDHAENQSGDD
jgi:hypothetical protein